tara:strand:- start:327 stop:3728 length:3402 start_codon:yes stop_codon:yes gene_type:complete
MKHRDLVDQLTEAIKIDVEVGDTILAGRFKNKKVKVKSIGKDEHGMPTINGKKVVNFRIPKKVDEVGFTTGDGGVIHGAPKVSKVKKMKKKGHTSVPYGSGYKKVKEASCAKKSNMETAAEYRKRCGPRPLGQIPKINESEVKTIHSLLQKFGNSSKDATDMIKKHYKMVAKKFRGQSPRDKTMAIIGISLLGEANAVKGSKVSKFITGYNLTMKGKKYKEIEFETLGVDNSSKMVKLRILSPKNLFGMEIPVKFQTLRRGPFLKTDTSKKIKEAPRKPRKKGQHRQSSSHSDLYTDENPKGTIHGLKFATVKDATKSVSKIKSSGKSHAHKIQAAVAMEQRAREMGKSAQAAVYRKFINQMKKKTKAKNEIKEQKEIKKVIGVYGGRFQPFGPHHLKTYQWLKTKVDEAYITTSGIQKPPRHPLSFSEKVKHMSKMGVPKNRIIQEKTPYIAKNLLSKFGDDVAVVYIFGKKDAGRLTGGKYFQDYKTNKDNLKGHEENGYIMTAPHTSINIDGKEVSGTVMRQLLGSPEYDDKKRKKLFKKAFGYFDKNVYITMVNKFKKLFEIYESIFESVTGGIESVDDGPHAIAPGINRYIGRAQKEANKLGFELVNSLVNDDAYNSQDKLKSHAKPYPNGPVDSVSYGPAGVGEISSNSVQNLVGTKLWNKWLDHIDKILGDTQFEYTSELIKSRKIAVKDSRPTAKQLDQELKEEIQRLVSEIPKNGKELLLMGGAFGHLSHPFEDRDLKFSDFKKIITQGLSGKLDRVQEKLDGMNIMISWKDNRLVSARTKKQLANAGADAQTIQAIKSKFKGRGDIADAFGNALDDLNIAIRGLSEKQKQKVFANGKKFVNLEILYPKASITVPYGLKMLVLHGSIEYDEAGNAIGSSQEDARMLGGMIQQINQDIQNTYTIKSNPILKLPQVKDFSAKQSKFLNRLKKLQSEYGLKDSDRIVEYHRRWWLDFIKTKADSLNYKIPKNVLDGLANRWGLRNKSAFTIPQMKKIDNEKFKNWAMKFNSDKYERQFDINMQKFENLILNLGAEILRSMNDLLVVSPNEAAQELRKKLSKAIITLSQSKDIKKLTIFKKFLERLNAIGGIKGIVPSEGIVFTYNDKLYKLTGTFTPMHRILTLLDF